MVLDPAVRAMSDDDTFHKMAGRWGVERFFAVSSSAQTGAEPALAVSELSGEQLEAVSLAMRPGGIRRAAGLKRHGQTQMFCALIWLHPVRHGTIRLAGRQRTARSPRAAGLVVVPGERKTEGVFNDLTTIANISPPVTRSASVGRFLLRRRECAADRDAAVRSPSISCRCRSSPAPGGDHQGAVLARMRWLPLLDPTRG